MSAGHTPTPWSLGGKATIKAIGPHGGTEYIATMENNAPRAANAEFIVRAVNAHDDMVAALRAVADYLAPGPACDIEEVVRSALAKAAQS